MHAAHRAGIVHRDLKPSNVLLTAEGVPKVGDFGLAKLADAESARTYSGQVMGTPSYMAPEQAEGRSREVGVAADVYALGAILYHELIGRPPFLGDSALETLRLVTTTDAVPPARLRPDVPRNLETICLKCLEKAPSKHYADAVSLAEDLRRFLEDRPILARPIGAVGRLWRWAGRNRRLAAAGAVVMTMFVMGAPAFFVLWRGAVADRAAALDAGDRAVAALGQAQAARERAERVRDRALERRQLDPHDRVGRPAGRGAAPYRRALAERGLHESQELVRTLEEDSDAEAQRVYGYLARAAAQFETGEAAASRESGLKAIELAEALVARDPSVSSREILGVAFHRLTSQVNDWELLRSYARRSNEILEAIGSERPDRPNPHHHAIALNYHNIGHAYYQEHRYGEAAATFDAGTLACREQIRRGDGGEVVRHDLGRILIYLCRVGHNLGHDREAVDAGERAVAVYREILDREPGNYPCAIQLYRAHEELSFAYEVLKRWDDMIASLEAARAILRASARQQAALVSRVAAIQGDLARIDFNLTRAYSSDPRGTINRSAPSTSRHSPSATSFRSSGRSPTTSARSSRTPASRWPTIRSKTAASPTWTSTSRPSGSGRTSIDASRRGRCIAPCWSWSATTCPTSWRPGAGPTRPGPAARGCSPPRGATPGCSSRSPSTMPRTRGRSAPIRSSSTRGDRTSGGGCSPVAPFGCSARRSPTGSGTSRGSGESPISSPSTTPPSSWMSPRRSTR